MLTYIIITVTHRSILTIHVVLGQLAGGSTSSYTEFPSEGGKNTTGRTVINHTSNLWYFETQNTSPPPQVLIYLRITWLSHKYLATCYRHS